MMPYVTKITFKLVTAKKLAENPTNSVIPQTIMVIRQLNTFISILAKGPKMFIAGPLVQALLNLYGLRGTFLVLAAISANHLVLGALMRSSDLEYSHKKDIKMKQLPTVSSKRNNNKGYTLKGCQN